MEPESFDEELREALQPSAVEVARLRAAALSIAPRKRPAANPIAMFVIAAVAGIVAWLSIRAAPFERERAAPTYGALVGNVGSIVRVRSGEQTLLVGTGDGHVRPKEPRRLWMSTEER